MGIDRRGNRTSRRRHRHQGNDGSNVSVLQATKMRFLRDDATLCITPGTEFMEKAKDACLYWAWQRLSNPRGPLSKVKIYVSPSTVPGEGEVKLLDWLIQAGSMGGQDRLEHEKTTYGPTDNVTSNQRNDNHGHLSRRNKKEARHQSRQRIVQPGHSVAILGGDSDLVLEGLAIPPAITHNVFVILPAGGKKSYAVSLWETTRTLGRFLYPHLNAVEDMMRVRTDLVLLLIMNGNDYLPKLRGSSGFNKLFHTYLKLLQSWLKDEHQSHRRSDGESQQYDRKKDECGDATSPEYNRDSNTHLRDRGRPRPFLVNPDTLEFNIPFCIAFFRKMANLAPSTLATLENMVPYQKSFTPLSTLNSMVDAGLLPGPARFVTLPFNDLDSELADMQGEGGKEVVRLSLGMKDDDSMRYYEFDILHRVGKTMKKTRQILANIALENILGKDYRSVNDYFLNGNPENEDDMNDDITDGYIDDDIDASDNDRTTNNDEAFDVSHARLMFFQCVRAV